jgi:hypothetical protein
MIVADAIIELTQRTTELLDVFNQQIGSVDARIAAAVLLSQNAAQIPLINIAASMINTQALLVHYIGTNT